jgi:hypothetical protein
MNMIFNLLCIYTKSNKYKKNLFAVHQKHNLINFLSITCTLASLVDIFTKASSLPCYSCLYPLIPLDTMTQKADWKVTLKAHWMAQLDKAKMALQLVLLFFLTYLKFEDDGNYLPFIFCLCLLKRLVLMKDLCCKKAWKVADHLGWHLGWHLGCQQGSL